MPEQGKKVVHPGSYCSEVGATGETKTGTPMICQPKDGAAVRPRWRRNGPPPPPKTGRRRKTTSGSAAVTPPKLADATSITPIDLTPAAPVQLPTPPEDLDGRIRDAYRQLAKKPGAFVNLTDLRDRLPDVPKDKLDEALKDSFPASDPIAICIDEPGGAC